jgi:hypothetical protein
MGSRIQLTLRNQNLPGKAPIPVLGGNWVASVAACAAHIRDAMGACLRA